MKIFKYLKTIIQHKFWVFYYCCKMKIPWQGLIHDLSKFSPTEFFESVKYYNGNVSPIVISKQKNNYSAAWQHHKGHNPHHYEYWVDNLDCGYVQPIIMPFKYALEMMCDYLGACRVYNKDKFSYQLEYEWFWNKCKSGIAMHPVIRKWLLTCFNSCATYNKLISYDSAKGLYEYYKDTDID